MEGDVVTGASGGESTIHDLYGAPSADDLALAAVLDGPAGRFDPQSDGPHASLWDEALLLVHEDLEDGDDREEVPESLLPDLAGLTF
jgi:hypothetical protein